jgi:tRNA-dihydrouridine synthase A
MVTTGAVIHGNADGHLVFNPEERPLALQLGGSDPADLARCAKIAEQRGYDEVNLNLGCPSDRVQRGRFGACLMLEADLVADCVMAMRDAVDIPVTVKTRLGVDEHYSYEFVSDFVSRLAQTGCTVFIMHARKAMLSGLSPKQNRDVPPLNYEWVYQLKREMPDLEIVINGGVGSLQQAEEHLEMVDGVMIGRAAYQNPWLLAECQQRLSEDAGVTEREQAVHEMTAYIEQQVRQGVAVKHISRHMLGLFQGLPGAKKWRRFLSENGYRDDTNTRLLEQALAAMKGA